MKKNIKKGKTNEKNFIDVYIYIFGAQTNADYRLSPRVQDLILSLLNVPI